MAEVVVTILNQAELDAFVSRARVLPPMVADAGGKVIERQTRERFNSKQGPDGPWAAWKPSTARRKKPGWSLMVASGTLAESFHASTSGTTSIIGSNVHYAKYHQTGTRHMVARPMVGVNATNVAELETRIAAFVEATL